jgi:putative flippase GtrA
MTSQGIARQAGARRAAFWQLFRYAVNGGLLTLLFVIVYWVVVQEMRFAPQIGTLAGYLVAVAAGYLLHSKVTFRAHGSRDRGTQLRFVAASLLSYALNAFWTWLCTEPLGWPPLSPLIPISTLTPFALFAVNRWWVFK